MNKNDTVNPVLFLISLAVLSFVRLTILHFSSNINIILFLSANENNALLSESSFGLTVLKIISVIILVVLVILFCRQNYKQYNADRNLKGFIIIMPFCAIPYIGNFLLAAIIFILIDETKKLHSVSPLKKIFIVRQLFFMIAIWMFLILSINLLRGNFKYADEELISKLEQRMEATESSAVSNNTTTADSESTTSETVSQTTTEKAPDTTAKTDSVNGLKVKTETKPTYPQPEEVIIPGASTSVKGMEEVKNSVKQTADKYGVYLCYVETETDGSLYMEISCENSETAQNVANAIGQNIKGLGYDNELMLDFTDINKGEDEPNRVLCSADIHPDGSIYFY